MLHFESATHRATVWVGDDEVVTHEGGYTPFEADVTEHVTAGRAGADHRAGQQHAELPDASRPGVIEDTPAGKRQRYWHDFFNYAGLHRSVWLYSTPHSHIDDITVVTGLDGAVGTVDYRCAAVNPDGLEVPGRPARRRRGARSRPAPARAARSPSRTCTAGRPAHGYLYDLEVQLVDEDGDVVDSYHQSVGVRTVEVGGTGSSSTANRSTSPASACTRTIDRDRQGRTTTRTSCTTSSCSTGSARTPSARRTTRTPRTSSTTPTGTASSSSTRPPPSGSTWASAAASSAPRATRPSRPTTDQRRDPRGARPGDPRAHRPRQEPPERRAVVDRQRARVRHRGRRGLLPAAVRRRPRGRPDPPGRVRQRHARPARQVPGLPVRRRAHAQPLLRLVRQHRRPRQRRDGLDRGARAAGPARASRSSSPSTAPTPIPACTRWRRSRGPRSTRSTTWT